MRAERNPPDSPIEEYLIGVFGGFLSIAYRRTGSRGPAARLLFVPARIDPVAWLRERIGDVTILGEGEPIEVRLAEAEQQPEPPTADEPIATDRPEPVAAAPQPPVQYCEKWVDTTIIPFRKCGEPITDGRDYCETHRAQYARAIRWPVDAAELMPPEAPAPLSVKERRRLYAEYVQATITRNHQAAFGGLPPGDPPSWPDLMLLDVLFRQQQQAIRDVA
jgi:hypothetical protein